jgi:hypothetical protein
MNADIAYVIVAIALTMAVCFVIYAVVRALGRYRGTRKIICPETNRQALVEVDAGHAVFTSAFGAPDIRLEKCSRWPLRKDCGQDCLTQLDVATPDCLVKGVLTQWYRGKYCVYCGNHFEHVQWFDHKPALQRPEGPLVDWTKIKLEELPNTLTSSGPVCWNCYVAQTFFQDHPDLVVYRPWPKGISNRENAAGESADRAARL